MSDLEPEFILEGFSILTFLVDKHFQEIQNYSWTVGFQDCLMLHDENYLCFFLFGVGRREFADL